MSRSVFSLRSYILVLRFRIVNDLINTYYILLILKTLASSLTFDALQKSTRISSVREFPNASSGGTSDTEQGVRIHVSISNVECVGHILSILFTPFTLNERNSPQSSVTI